MPTVRAPLLASLPPVKVFRADPDTGRYEWADIPDTRTPGVHWDCEREAVHLLAPVANPHDGPDPARSDLASLFLFWFGSGSYSAFPVYAWADRDNLCDALEDAAAWVRDSAPGVFVEPDYDEAARDIGAPDDWREDQDWCEKVWSAGDTDLTYTESGHLMAEHWTARDVTDADEWRHVQRRSLEERESHDGNPPPAWYVQARMAGAADDSPYAFQWYTARKGYGRRYLTNEDCPDGDLVGIDEDGTEHPCTVADIEAAIAWLLAD